MTSKSLKTTEMPPTMLPPGSLFSDSDPGVLSEVGEATTQTEDPPIYSSSSVFATSLSSEAVTSSCPTTDDDTSEADSVMDRLTRSVGRLFTMVITSFVPEKKRIYLVLFCKKVVQFRDLLDKVCLLDLLKYLNLYFIMFSSI